MQLKNPSIVHKIAEVDCDEKQNPFIALGMSCTSNLVQINHFKYESKNKKKSVNCSNVVCIITLHQKANIKPIFHERRSIKQNMPIHLRIMQNQVDYNQYEFVLNVLVCNFLAKILHS